MMCNSTILVTFFLFIAFTRCSIPSTGLYWVKKFGTTGVDTLDVRELDDGTILVMGEVFSFGLSFANDIFLSLLNGTTGEVLSARIIRKDSGVYNDESFRNMQFYQTSDGGLLISGITKKQDFWTDNAFLIKVRKNLTVEWSKKLGDTQCGGSCGSYAPSHASEEGDHYYLGVKAIATGVMGYKITKLDKSGNVIENKYLFNVGAGSVHCPMAGSVQAKDKSGSFVFGYAHAGGFAGSYGYGAYDNYDAIICKFKYSAYLTTWCKVVNNDDKMSVFLSVASLEDGSAIAMGEWQDGSGNRYYFVMRLRGTDGTMEWSTFLGESDHLLDCCVYNYELEVYSVKNNKTGEEEVLISILKGHRVFWIKLNAMTGEFMSSYEYLSPQSMRVRPSQAQNGDLLTIFHGREDDTVSYLARIDPYNDFICGGFESSELSWWMNSTEVKDGSAFSFAQNVANGNPPTFNAASLYAIRNDLPVKMIDVTNAHQIVDEEICMESKLKCLGISAINISDVCDGHGFCVSENNCSCFTSYYGNTSTDCSEFECFEKHWDAPNTCNYKNGSCVAVDTCDCGESGYFGEECELWNCDGVLYNDSTSVVCRGHGRCVGPDKCQCDLNYNLTQFCEWGCGEYDRLNSELVCSKSGDCVGFNNCSCQKGYRGQECEHWSCFGIFIDDTIQAGSQMCEGGHGTCVSLDRCNCDRGYSKSNDEVCDEWFCGEFFYSDNRSCNSHGNCSGHYSCKCEKGYTGLLCEQFSCGVYPAQIDDEKGCGNHGKCVRSQWCDCDDGYDGNLCEIWKCNHIFKNESSNVCNGGKGECVSSELCDCEAGYYGKYCQYWFCNSVMMNETALVCNEGHGNCLSPEKCECEKGYYSTYCSSFDCFSVHKDEVGKVCDGAGKCKGPDNCECETGFGDDDCSTNLYLTTVMTPVLATTGTGVIVAVIVAIIVVACVIFCCTFCLLGCLVCCVCVCLLCCVCCVVCCMGCVSASQFKKLKKFGKLRNIDLLLEEQAAEDDETIAHISINKDLFEIDVNEISVKSILGEGGSNSVVYKASWKAQTVAFKCFKTRTICSSQDKFDEFEREVSILSSVSHPNVVRFFGCSLNPPRVGILMEFCDNGELLMFLLKFHSKKKKMYPFNEKVRCLKEIASAMEYLHSRSIIHRDLKPENVLMDKNECCKLMDFGVSKLARDTTGHQTKRVGTSYFMAPEVVVGSVYDSKCDVFSFGIMMQQILSEDQNPYAGVTEECFNIEHRVCSDPDFRPDPDRLESVVGSGEFPWIKSLVTKCWNHDPARRPSFKELIELFQVQHRKSVPVSVQSLRESEEENESSPLEEERKMESESEESEDSSED